MAKQTFFEGQTATNPGTGQKIIFQKGKWVPMGAAGAGAPAPPVDPQSAGYLKDLREKASQSLNVATQAENFLKLNQSTPTGGMAGWPFVGGLVRDKRRAEDPNWAQMEAITSGVAPGMRPPGSGSSSDKDTEMYIGGFTNTRVPYATNKATAARLKDQSTFNAAHAAFIDSWYQRHGTLLGGEQAFSQYWANKSGQGGGDGGMQVQLPGGGVAVVRPR